MIEVTSLTKRYENLTAVADLDFGRLAGIRERLPALRHRRDDVYGPA